MKRMILLLTGAVVTGLFALTVAPRPSEALFDVSSDIAAAQQNLQQQIDGLAALFAGTPVTADVKSINVATSGGFECNTGEGNKIKTSDGKSIVITSSDGKTFVLTAPGEDRLRTLLSTLEAAMLANLNVTFIANGVNCPANTYNTFSVTIAK